MVFEIITKKNCWAKFSFEWKMPLKKKISIIFGLYRANPQWMIIALDMPYAINATAERGFAWIWSSFPPFPLLLTPLPPNTPLFYLFFSSFLPFLLLSLPLTKIYLAQRTICCMFFFSSFPLGTEKIPLNYTFNCSGFVSKAQICRKEQRHQMRKFWSKCIKREFWCKSIIFLKLTITLPLLSAQNVTEMTIFNFLVVFVHLAIRKPANSRLDNHCWNCNIPSG